METSCLTRSLPESLRLLPTTAGRAFIIRHGENGFVAGDLAGFVSRLQWLIQNPA